jgi:hypothetical protein
MAVFRQLRIRVSDGAPCRRRGPWPKRQRGPGTRAQNERRRGSDGGWVQRKAARAPIEDESGAIAILHIGRVEDDVQQEAERVDEDVPLAPRDLLARIVAVRVLLVLMVFPTRLQ